MGNAEFNQANRMLKLCTFLLLSCMQSIFTNNSGKVTAEKVVLLDKVPSGSGIAVVNGAVFIAGDDSPWLFKLNEQWEVINKYLLMKDFVSVDRIPKGQKPDLEAIAEAEIEGEPHLFIFGSGAKSPERDWLYDINLSDMKKVKNYSIKPFYNKVLEVTGLSQEDLNIEGAVVAGEKLYLFNRGRNNVIVTHWKVFYEYLIDKKSVDELQLKSYIIQLPSISGIQAGISGACAIPGSNKILFTATIENTSNWIDDGEILGSYVGVLDTKQLESGKVENISIITNNNGEPLKDKVESIAFLKKGKDRTIHALAVADNDNGTSKIIELKIQM
jgi:hypothetical protein